MKIIYLSCILIALIISCKDTTSSIQNRADESVTSSVLGETNAKRIYLKKIYEFYRGTDIPFIIPPDSIKSKIEYPDTLYEKGIFAYAMPNQITKIIDDTTFICGEELLTNLYTEILNEMNNKPSSGQFTVIINEKYVLEDSLIYRILYNGSRKLIYDLPLIVGKSFISADYYSNYTNTIICDTLISVEAGIFNVLKIEVVGDHLSETKYVSLEKGLIKSILKYDMVSHHVGDTNNWFETDYIETLELTSIEYN